jgi:phosphoenolpyruvate carboxykinase (ATP)
MLGEKLRKNNVKVWMINTGWTGGGYGVGNRMKLSYTRAMITAALEGKLDKVSFENHPVFGVAMPTECPNVPSALLNPQQTWADKAAYDKAARGLAQQFVKNFEKYASGVEEEVLEAAPAV